MEDDLKETKRNLPLLLASILASAAYYVAVVPCVLSQFGFAFAGMSVYWACVFIEKTIEKYLSKN